MIHRMSIPDKAPSILILSKGNAMRHTLHHLRIGLFCCTFVIAAWSTSYAQEKPQDIGSNRELFVTGHLIDQLDGAARQVLHPPTPQEIVLVADNPWEGNGLNYVTVFRDGDLYKMYYRGADVRYTETGYSSPHPQVYCYATSTDGIHWKRPTLNLVEFDGSTDNNIIVHEKDWGYAAHNFSPFLDKNPNAKPSGKYKAVAGGPLIPLVSADGIHWTKGADKPIISFGDFDSHNLAFWDVCREEYRAYHRKSRNGRDIMTETSDDFFSGWTEPKFLDYTPARGGQLYTNQITQYHRAPQYFLGFPTRYEDRGFTASTKHLPQWEYRQLRAAKSRREGTAVTEGLFMASRDGENFRVWQEAFIRPGLRTNDSWFYGDNYQNWGLVETESSLAPDAPNELSMYVTEATLQNDKPARLRRYTLRLDGFVSMAAPMDGGKVTTKPILFAGKQLTVNYSSSARGGIRVGLLDTNGKAIPGYSLDECPWIYGDSIERVVEWKRGKGVDEVTTDVSPLAGKPVHIVFELKDADLYSFQFSNASAN